MYYTIDKNDERTIVDFYDDNDQHIGAMIDSEAIDFAADIISDLKKKKIEVDNNE